MPEIKSKAQFFALWEAGVLGNRTRLWRNPEDAIEWVKNHAGPYFEGVGFRELRRAGTAGAGKWQRVPVEEVWKTVNEWRAEGRDFIMDDGVPNTRQTLIGELVRTERGLEGFIGLSKLPMRPAMAAGHMKHRSYLETRLLLEQYMDPSSRDDVDMLLEMYPDHAIEFTCFEVNVGIFPRRNTMLWEVRRY